MGKYAFRVNRLHGYAGLFPLGFELHAVDQGIWSASFHAQSVAESAEIIAKYAHRQICIFEVGHYWTDSTGENWLPLTEIAEEQGLHPRVLDRDVILIETGDLSTLLADFSHYDMSVLDLEGCVNDETALGSVLAALEGGWSSDRTVLVSLPESGIFLRSHDGCYLYVESRKMAHLREHLGLLLKSFVSARLDKDVPLPPPSIAEQYLALSSTLTILDEHTNVSTDSVKLFCTAETLSSKETKDCPPIATIIFDTGDSHWRLEEYGHRSA